VEDKRRRKKQVNITCRGCLNASFCGLPTGARIVPFCYIPKGQGQLKAKKKGGGTLYYIEGKE